MNVLAIIPARGGSKAVKLKNIHLFNGKPLMAYTIGDAKRSRLISRVVVSTDNQEIASVAESLGAEVPFLRPPEIATCTTPDLPVVRHCAEFLKQQGWNADIIVWLRPTQIFRTANDIDLMIEKCIQNEHFHSVRAICKASYPPHWMKVIRGEYLEAFLPSEPVYTRRQDLPEVYQGNGTIEVFRYSTVLTTDSMYGHKVGYYMMDDWSHIDVDTYDDLLRAEVLYQKWIEIGGNNGPMTGAGTARVQEFNMNERDRSV